MVRDIIERLRLHAIMHCRFSGQLFHFVKIPSRVPILLMHLLGNCMEAQAFDYVLRGKHIYMGKQATPFAPTMSGGSDMEEG